MTRPKLRCACEGSCPPACSKTPGEPSLCGRGRIVHVAERSTQFGSASSGLIAVRRPMHGVESAARGRAVFCRDRRTRMLMTRHGHGATVLAAGITPVIGLRGSHMGPGRARLSGPCPADAGIGLRVRRGVGRGRVLVGSCCATHAAGATWGRQVEEGLIASVVGARHSIAGATQHHAADQCRSGKIVHRRTHRVTFLAQRVVPLTLA